MNQAWSFRQTAQNRRFAAILLCILAAGGAYAQNSGAGQGVFSPVVSQLTAEVRNNFVRLSWIDSRDAHGPVYIYRSVRQIDSAALTMIRPVTIPYGTQYFVDETEGAAAYYYFVAASDVYGQRYDIIIPFSNTVSTGAPASSWDDTPIVPQGRLPQTSEIAGLSTYVDGERVIVSFTINGYAKNAILYRNTQPIRRIQDLISAVIVQSSNISPVIDYPAPGYSYYYALFFEDDISRGTVDVRPGRNTTITPVTIAGRAPPAPPVIRAIPLPPMSAENASGGGYAQVPQAASPGIQNSPNRVETPQAASSGTQNPPYRIETPQAPENTQSRPAVPAKRPRVFTRDLEMPAGGEESTLRTIVQGPFTMREWSGARDQLAQYLSLPRSSETEARARFYLGQAYYFSGQNREALVEFLFVRDRFPNEAAEWIEAVLAAMRR